MQEQAHTLHTFFLNFLYGLVILMVLFHTGRASFLLLSSLQLAFSAVGCSLPGSLDYWTLPSSLRVFSSCLASSTVSAALATSHPSSLCIYYCNLVQPCTHRCPIPTSDMRIEAVFQTLLLCPVLNLAQLLGMYICSFGVASCVPREQYRKLSKEHDSIEFPIFVWCKATYFEIAFSLSSVRLTTKVLDTFLASQNFLRCHTKVLLATWHRRIQPTRSVRSWALSLSGRNGATIWLMASISSRCSSFSIRTLLNPFSNSVTAVFLQITLG